MSGRIQVVSRKQGLQRGVDALVASESGAAAIEYAIIAAMLSIAIVAVVPEIGTTVANLFNAVKNAF
jgi:Flp pilus assembly pilin Flp